MWDSGSTPRLTSSGVCRRGSFACICSMFDRRLPCVSIAAFGKPAVPLVNISTARSSSSRSTSRHRRLRGEQVVERHPSGDVDVLGDDAELERGEAGPVESATASTARRGRRRSARAPTSPSCFSSSRAGLLGLRGTATRPAPSAERYAATKYQLVPHRIPTRSPGSRPRPTRPARTAAACSRSSWYVVVRPRLTSATASSGCGSSTVARFRGRRYFLRRDGRATPALSRPWACSSQTRSHCRAMTVGHRGARPDPQLRRRTSRSTA